MNFIHASDFHLGYAQYNLKERFVDLAKAFQNVIQYAHENDAEFILLAGDLFHKRNINAPTYLQGYRVLKRLKKLRAENHKPEIQVFAIEGNHDLAYHSDGHSWLEILSAQGLLHLFKLRKAEGVEIMGDFVDVGEVRIFGVKYLGASTRFEIPRIAKEIQTINERYGRKYTILMMHFGVEGQNVKEGIEVPYSALSPLRDVVDYLALGHYHIQYSADNWMFNGGSPEILSTSECGFSKGFYHVTDDGVRLIHGNARPMKRIVLDTSSLQSPDDLYAAVESTLEKEEDIDSDMKPMIELTLYGTFNFPKADISIDRIKKLIGMRYSPLWTEVRIQRLNSVYNPGSSEMRGQSREEIERRVLSDMVTLDGRFREHVDLVASTLIDVKTMASGGENPEAILTKIRASYMLIEAT